MYDQIWFAIKEKGTDKFLPAVYGNGGATVTETTNLKPPRLFLNRYRANRTLALWEKGISVYELENGKTVRKTDYMEDRKNTLEVVRVLFTMVV